VYRSNTSHQLNCLGGGGKKEGKVPSLSGQTQPRGGGKRKIGKRIMLARGPRGKRQEKKKKDIWDRIASLRGGGRLRVFV